MPPGKRLVAKNFLVWLTDFWKSKVIQPFPLKGEKEAIQKTNCWVTVCDYYLFLLLCISFLKFCHSPYFCDLVDTITIDWSSFIFSLSKSTNFKISGFPAKLVLVPLINQPACIRGVPDLFVVEWNPNIYVT